jgi:alpha-L-fucosidase
MRMKKIFVLFCFLSMCTILSAQLFKDQQAGYNRNKPERQEWLRDLGFGMFIHLSFDSQLGIIGGHAMVGASDDYVNRFVYELPQTFDPKDFDPYKIAIKAKLAGMKYVVLTTKNHSGFCLWDTQTTDFNIMNTPYGRDIVREFVDAVRKAGLGVGLYYSIDDFKFLYDRGVILQRGDGLKYSDEIKKEYLDFIRRQTNELYTRYGEIDVMFIDGSPNESCKDEAWNLQPDLVITRGAINTPEQRIPGIAEDVLWESCVTMGTGWAYKPTNDIMKSGGMLIEILIETRAKGGNLLLNVGPTPDGEIADPESRRLTELSAWYFINHEAIDNVRPWIITHEDNIWFTASKDRKTVYATITGIPDWNRGDRKEFVLGSIKSTPSTKISVLGQNDLVVEYKEDIDPKSRFSQKVDGLHISVVRAQRLYNNHKWPNPIVVKIENVEPALDPPAVKTSEVEVENGNVQLKGDLVKMGNEKSLMVGFEYRPYADLVQSIYKTDWHRTKLIKLSNLKEFSDEIQGLKKGERYEFRAVVVHPKMDIYGERIRITIK